MQCKYCYENFGNTIYPCDCKNPVHVLCLIKWNSYRKKSTHCEICIKQYKFSFFVNMYVNFYNLFLDYFIYIIVLFIIYFFIITSNINSSLKAYEML